MIGALVIRRFVGTRHGDAEDVLVARQRVMPALPPHGTLIDFGDGTGAAGVAAVVIHCSDVNRAPGFYPPSVEIKTGKEPAERLEAALLAGWMRIDPIMMSNNHIEKRGS